MKVWVTGATGLCGRAVVEVLKEKFEVLPTAFSRAKGETLKVDLTSDLEVKAFFEEHKPDALIHLAAERKPDICENNKQVTDSLNIQATQSLAQLCKAYDCWFLYLSTDYVFDGTAPPYKPDSATNPLNYYGISKLRGEEVSISENDQAAILRVPVLYGKVEDLGESAITSIAKLVLAGEEAKVDHWATRFPTLVDDVGKVIAKMLSGKPSGIFHYSGEEAITKYETAVMMAEKLCLQSAHLIAEPNQKGTALRPKNAELDTSSLQTAGYYVKPTSMESVISDILSPHT